MTTKRNNSGYYLLEKFAKNQDGLATNEEKYTLVTIEQLLPILDKAKENDERIAIWEVGECVLDWS